MAEPFMAELRLFSFDYPPKGWAQCNGQFLPINQNQALFALLGTMYGGNGQTTFALPDLRGRAPIHRGNGFTQGTRAGTEFHTVSMNEMPAHTHTLSASSTDGDQASPKFLAAAGNSYAAAGNLTTLHPATLSNIGGSQAHENRQPYLVLNWCISLQGIFPSHG